MNNNDEIEKIIDGIDLSKPAPEKEPQRQYYFIILKSITIRSYFSNHIWLDSNNTIKGICTEFILYTIIKLFYRYVFSFSEINIQCFGLEQFV